MTARVFVTDEAGPRAAVPTPGRRTPGDRDARRPGARPAAVAPQPRGALPDGAPWDAGRQVILPRGESHYLVRVRRWSPGEVVEVLAPGGPWWRAEVVSPDPTATVLRLLAPRLPPTGGDAAVSLVLVWGAPETSVILDALPSLCELGVERVSLWSSERATSSRPSAARVAKVLRATLRQCGRPEPPIVDCRDDLLDAMGPGPRRWWFGALPRDDRLDDAGDALPVGARAVARADASIGVVVGPEGGLTAREQLALRDAGATPICLGAWTLRSSTAATALCAVALHATARVTASDPANRHGAPEPVGR